MKSILKGKPQGDGTRRLFFFPHSGSGPGPYLQWASALPQWETYGVQYPGHGSRMAEPLCERMPALVESIIADGKDLFSGKFAFFGHSLGSLVAFEVARALESCGLKAPDMLLLSAMPAPHLDIARRRGRDITTADLYEMMEASAPALMEKMREDPDLEEMFLSILKADLQMLKNYEAGPIAPVDTSILVFGGEGDNIPPAELEAWRPYARGAFSLDMLRGGHFYYSDQLPSFLELINGKLHGHD